MVDTLSRIQGANLLAIALSVEHGTLLVDIKKCWEHDSQLSVMIEKLKYGKPYVLFGSNDWCLGI